MHNNLISSEALLNLVIQSLENFKAGSITSLDVHNMTSITDYMVIANGTSSRHVSAIADNLIEKIKSLNISPCSIEGDEDNDWVLVDLGDVVVHVMQPRARAYYNLEKLWSPQAELAQALA